MDAARRRILQVLGAAAVGAPLSSLTGLAQGRCMLTFGSPACNTTDNDPKMGKGFESFRVKDPDGWDVQICNGNGLTKARRSKSNAKLSVAAPFAPTGWKTVWLDHFSFNCTNYKESASFYQNLLGW